MDADKEDSKALGTAIRLAKKANRPQKIGIADQKASKSHRNPRTTNKPSLNKGRSIFESEVGRKPKAKERKKSKSQ